MDKQRLAIFGIAGMSLLLAASVSMTVAWYIGSSYLSVKQFKITLQDQELQISTDNENFAQFIPNEELMEVDRFRAVSTMFCNDWISRKEERPVFKGGFGFATSNVVNSINAVGNIEKGYFCQEIYLKSLESDVYVTLDPELTTFVPDNEKNQSIIQDLREKYPGFTDDEIYANLNNVVRSIRVSLLVLNDSNDDSGEFPDYAYYIVDPFKDKITYMGGILDNDKSGYYDYSEENKEILYGECHSADPNKTVEECIVYQEPTASSSHVSVKELTCFTSGNQEGVRKIDFDASFANGLVLEEEHSVALESVDKEVLIPLRTGISKRIVLSFYQEGWDFENTDFVRYSNFYINVMFKIARPLY